MVQVGESSIDQAGDIGGEGVSRFHWVGPEGLDIAPADVTAVHTALHAFYAVVAQNAAHSITYAIQPEARILDEQTGELVAAVNQEGTLADIPSLGVATGYPAGAGARINWHTGVVVGGRRIRGATFLVPLQAAAFTQQGSLSGNVQQGLIAAAATLNGALQSAGCNLIVYRRPPKGATTGGVAALTQAWTIGSRPAMLRSRTK